jgi:hypothetical protein
LTSIRVTISSHPRVAFRSAKVRLETNKPPAEPTAETNNPKTVRARNMGLEHYYQLLDRSLVDPFVSQTWRGFHKRYGWTDRTEWETAGEFLTEFALEPEPASPEEVERILAGRTLEWTLRHSSPRLFCLTDGMLVHAPRIAKRCPYVEVYPLEEIAILLATAVLEFTERRMTQRAFRVVVALHGGALDPEWLKLPHRQAQILRAALEPSPLPKRVFRWQDPNDPWNGYHTLGTADTRRFYKFLRQAWDDNRSCTFLRAEVASAVSNGSEVTIRDSKSAKALLANAPSPGQRSCIFRFFG